LGNICVIPARGGSKRIPGKNIRDFLGKPIIAYAIELARETNLFDEVMVSTEDENIASIARYCGANVPFMRSAKTADDFATTRMVLEEVLVQYLKLGRVFDNLMCIYPTAVLANIEDIKNGLKILAKADLVLPVTKFSYPPQRSFKLNDKGFIDYRYPEFVNSRSQDLDSWYYDAGQWYWYRLFDGHFSNLPISRGFVELNQLRVQDIDSQEDWKIAEIKYKIAKEIL
jgi:N-acylneuraminate cytidylyltransferase